MLILKRTRRHKALVERQEAADGDGERPVATEDDPRLGTKSALHLIDHIGAACGRVSSSVCLTG